jgi:DNA-binding beta-propeller fold protein YncE
MSTGARILIMAAGTAAVFLPPNVAAQTENTIKAGQVIGGEPGQTINGWTQVSGGLYPHRVTSNFVTKEVYDCCQSVFRRGNAYLVTRGEAVAKKPTGGVDAERILATMTIIKRASETAAECSILWLNPALSLYDEKTKVVRSVIISGDEFVTLTWTDNNNFCDLGD